MRASELRAGQWRLLDNGEQIIQGDEVWSHGEGPWKPVRPEKIGKHISSCSYLHRRQLVAYPPDRPDYATRQAAWVEANGIEVGSRVKITRVAKHGEGGWYGSWYPGMDGCVEEVKTVSGVSDAGIEVAGCNWPYFVLEPVEPAVDPEHLKSITEQAPTGDYEPAAPQPLQVREGGWYRMRNGDIDGPASRRGLLDWPWRIGDRTFRDDGTTEFLKGNECEYDLIAEVPPPEPVATESSPSHHTAQDFMGKWCPDYDPITLDPFFMWIENNGQWVPTYGGPYDSYTLSQPYDLKEGTKRVDVEYHRQRFCHDEGCWRESETLCERVVSEGMLIDLGVWDEKAEVPPPSEQESSERLWWIFRDRDDGTYSVMESISGEATHEGYKFVNSAVGAGVDEIYVRAVDAKNAVRLAKAEWNNRASESPVMETPDKVAPEIDPGEGWRLLSKDEPVQEGDDVNMLDDVWVPAANWRHGGKHGEGCTYRRRITPEPELEATTQLNIDISPSEEARALHRVVRAMHDGHCPNCGHLDSSERFQRVVLLREIDHVCPECHFTVTWSEAAAALNAFHPFMRRNLDVFRTWQARRNEPPCGAREAEGK